MRNKILVVAAHPDDEILGCGGTTSKLAQKGDTVYTLILGKGIAARGLSEQDIVKETEYLNTGMN